MAEEKVKAERIYNTGKFKGLKKVDFYRLVESLLDGEELTEIETDFLYTVVNAEKRKAEKAQEKTDAARQVREAEVDSLVQPLVGREPVTADELTQILAHKGVVTSEGKGLTMFVVRASLNRAAKSGKIIKMRDEEVKKTFYRVAA